jgi:hypothetical protein
MWYMLSYLFLIFYSYSNNNRFMLRENSHVESKNLSTKIKFYFETNKTLDRRVQIYKEALKQGLPGGRAGWSHLILQGSRIKMLM